MPSLLDKLRALDAEEAHAAKPAATAIRPMEHRTDSFPLGLFASGDHLQADLLETLFRCPFPKDVKREDILFLDTETTGLSGGVGTLAFEIGVGYFLPDRFCVEQYMICDYTQESEMLIALNSLMKRFSVICTFNGKSFDVPLLQSRFTMNRIRTPAIPQIHADALYPARRLWKLRLQSCSLSALEEALLDVKRDDDLPGALVPQTFFRFLEDRDFEPLSRVLDHNRQDIVSLAQLFFHMCAFIAQPETVREDTDLFSLARLYGKAGNHAAEKKCYRLLSRGSMWDAAFDSLAVQEKREGHTDRAIRLYEAMLRRGEQAPKACEALAKLYEHQKKDIATALSYTRLGLMLLSETRLTADETVQEMQKALQYRYTRLRRKMRSMQAGDKPSKENHHEH